MRTIRFLLRKEYRQIFRDRVMLAQILIMPIVKLVVLANAATFEVKRSRLYVVDEDRTEASRGLVRQLTASGRFAVEAASPSMALADDAMLRRRVDAILRIPADWSRDLTRTGSAPVQLVLDAKDGAAAGVTQSYASRIITDYGASLAGPRPGAPPARVEVRRSE